jgi:hypothetical protein
MKNKPYCKSCISEEKFKEPQEQVPDRYPYPYPYPYSYPYPYYQTGPGVPPRPQPERDPAGTIVISGTMLIMVGILGLISPIIMFSMYLPSIPLFGVRDVTASSWIFVCFILPFIFSLFTIIGGFSLLQKKNFQFGLMGAFFGIFTWGFYFGSIISFIILIILISSYSDIAKTNKKEEKSS